MFKIKAEPTIDAALTIEGQGRTQKLNVTFKHFTRSGYTELLNSIASKKKSIAEVTLSVLVNWDASFDGEKPAELSLENIKQLHEQQPGSDWAILTGLSEAISVARKGN